ncbi:S8 family peptidase [Sodalis sp. dw_96]|uniref:S8 family peptidase n=1 Tax=Sodalis sp. dw_96 TaxID=2719794 RepID=UPI001BD1F92E|nr:S8 family peptidase [Sodalis sp. dw_96]
MDYRHLLIEGYALSEEYKANGFGSFLKFKRTTEERQYHGQTLLQTLISYPLSVTLDFGEESEKGIFLTFESMPGYEINIDSLDNKSIRLCNVNFVNNVQMVTVFIPENKRLYLQNKITTYAEQLKKVSNNNLFDNVHTIRIADIQSFFTSHQSLYPDENAVLWWEVWLTVRSFDRTEVDNFLNYCRNNNISVGKSKILFGMVSVVVVKASINELKKSLVLISCLQELRLVVDTPHFILTQNPHDQADWVRSILSRVIIGDNNDVSAVILDGGVNYNHPLISIATNPRLNYSWDSAWPDFDIENDHGTRQAGLILYGDLADVIVSEDSINIPYLLETCRILPPNNDSDKELYGALMYFSVSKSRENIDNNKIFSLAVTTDNDGLSGQPTSWSAEIDQINFSGIGNNIFIISAGNIRDLSLLNRYPAVNREFAIEDPAQSWNALTVGAYTQKVSISEASFRDWTPQAASGGLCPTSRTSINWDWKKEGPFKPDIVEEGGNILISPDSVSYTNADCVSLATTSGLTAGGALFTDHRETSAATALTTRLAANLWSTYPGFWPETIRGLIVHSAAWTPEMLHMVEVDSAQGLKPKDCKENLLRAFGHGVPNYNRTINSSNSYLTMICQETLKPYKIVNGEVKMNEMNLIKLPWPAEELIILGASEVKLRVTLSYFIEPNPGRKSYKSRFRYQSHGLRFKMINSTENINSFITRINQEDDDYEAADNTGWFLGDALRRRGSLHQDTWKGIASDLSTRNILAVYPVSGWWKNRSFKDNRALQSVRYSLIVSLDVGDTDLDIYASVSNTIAIDNEAKINNAVEIVNEINI